MNYFNVNDGKIEIQVEDEKRCFIPCKRKEDGKIGLYETYSQRFLEDSKGEYVTEEKMKELYEKLKINDNDNIIKGVMTY